MLVVRRAGTSAGQRTRWADFLAGGNMAKEPPEVSARTLGRAAVIQPNGWPYARRYGDLPLAWNPAGGCNARNSPAIRVADLLLRMGAEVRAADPLVTEPTVIAPAVARVYATPEEIAAADIVTLLTDHDAFLATDIGRYARHVLDCRRVLSGPNVETL